MFYTFLFSFLMPLHFYASLIWCTATSNGYVLFESAIFTIQWWCDGNPLTLVKTLRNTFMVCFSNSVCFRFSIPLPSRFYGAISLQPSPTLWKMSTLLAFDGRYLSFSSFYFFLRVLKKERSLNERRRHNFPPFLIRHSVKLFEKRWLAWSYSW